MFEPKKGAPLSSAQQHMVAHLSEDVAWTLRIVERKRRNRVPPCMQAYMCGHDQSLEYLYEEGHNLHYIISGAGSEVGAADTPNPQYVSGTLSLLSCIMLQVSPACNGTAAHLGSLLGQLQHPDAPRSIQGNTVARGFVAIKDQLLGCQA